MCVVQWPLVVSVRRAVSLSLSGVLTCQHPGRGGESNALVAFSPALLSICSNSAKCAGWGACRACARVLALLQCSAESPNKDLWFHVNTNVFMMTNSAACSALSLFIQHLVQIQFAKEKKIWSYNIQRRTPQMQGETCKFLAVGKGSKPRI